VGTFHIEDPLNWISLSAFLVTSLVASQLSELARRNHALATKAEAARQSEQFKSTLVDAVAHEFTTPLTSIKAAASTILSSDSLTGEQRQELLTIIDQEADRLTSLMREAFHLARAEAGKMHLSRKPHDVRALIDETLRQASASLNGRPVQIECDRELPQMQVDADLFIVAFKQLMDNAAKYSPPGSLVRIAVEASGDSVWIRVHNQGPGLSEREQTMVFDRFYRSDSTSKSVPGIGIGLAIAQEIAKAHGGFVNVESGPGMGTEFSIRLPLIRTSTA
jgi:two-component system sensor histidine kinase KdpD